MHRRCLLLLLLAGCAPAASGDPPAPVTTVYVVRHGERVSEEGNASLSAVGLARAAALHELTRSAAIAAVYVTEFCRTAQTAEPTAVAAALPLRVASLGSRSGGLDACSPPIRAVIEPLPQPTPPQALAELILRDWSGRSVLVVGHSNTVPTIVEALGAPALCGTLLPASESSCQLEHDAYGDVFIVRIPAEGTPTVEQRRIDPV